MTQPYHHGALRQALLDAAESILERDGIAALTLRAAAREAGVSHAAPTHHFGSLAGLLSALAASGFTRFRARILDEFKAAGAGIQQRRTALSRGYVGFARTSPGLFQLMFRSEQLDWSNPDLAAAGTAAFSLMVPAEDTETLGQAPLSLAKLTAAMSHWSMVHGLATLLIDGRLDAVAHALSGDVDIEKLIEQMLIDAGA